MTRGGVILHPLGVSGPEFYDTAANLASANPTVSAGLMAVESDTGLFKIGDGSTAYNDLPYYAPGSQDLDFASTTTQQTGIDGTITDITGLSISFDVISRPVWVEFHHPWIQAVTNLVNPILYLRNVSGSTNRRQSVATTIAAGEFTQGRVAERIVTPGSYSIKASVNRSGTGTITSLADTAAIVATLRAYEA